MKFFEYPDLICLYSAISPWCNGNKKNHFLLEKIPKNHYFLEVTNCPTSPPPTQLEIIEIYFSFFHLLSIRGALLMNVVYDLVAAPFVVVVAAVVPVSIDNDAV